MQNDVALDVASDVASRLRIWRSHALNSLLIASVIVAAPLMISLAVDAVANPERWPAVLAFLALYLLEVALLVFRHLRFHLRACGTLLVGYLIGVVAFARGGLAGDGRVYLLALPVLATILIGRRAGLLMAILGLFTFAAFAVTTHLEWTTAWLVRKDAACLLIDWAFGWIAFALVLVGIVSLQRHFSRMQQTIAVENSRLHKESERLREFTESIVHNMQEGILIEDAKGCITFVNPKAAELLGYAPEGLTGQHWKTTVSPESVAKVEEEAAKRPAGITSHYEATLLTKGGQRMPVIVSACPLFQNGCFSGVLSVFTDITAHKRAEQQAIRTERLAAMGYIAAALAHEIGNPLQTIRGNLELLLTFGLEPDEHRERLGIALEEIDRLVGITRQTLDFARPAVDTRYPVPIAQTIQRVLALMDRQLQLSSIQVTTSFPTDTLFVFAAPDQIVQILLNIAANAIEAMPGGGHLDITAYADGDVAVLVFSNDGPHLTSEQMGHIFDPFFTTKPEGTGLGLSISHRLIEQHGGTISVENLEGERGVVYTITLPIPCISEEEVTA